jgi:glyoxylase-like metal-dependent hydrolase (beta-lactamase superfamily II)
MRGRLPGLVELDAGNPGPLTGAGNRTWLLTGAVATLIDAGVGRPAHLDALQAALEAAGERLRQVLVSHAHPDHASGAAALASRWPEARFRKCPWPERDRLYPVRWQALADGDTVEAGDLRLEVVHTPGHAPDHLCFWHAPSRTLFGADLLIEGGTVVVPGTGGGDLSAYLRSLARVAALSPTCVLPAHGPTIEDPLGVIERYSAHRARREEAILQAIAGGAADVDAVVAAVYPGLAGTLQRAATESAHAHIRKLRDEGRVRDRAGRLLLAPRAEA